MSKRTIAIGDIHGCSTALDALLDWLQPTKGDLIIPLGDYVDRGPDSRGVLDRLLDLGKRCRMIPILGNHEEMMLAARMNPNEVDQWLTVGGLEAIRSYGPGDPTLDNVPQSHWDFLESCREYFETPTHIFTHANYVHELPMIRQPRYMLRWASLSFHCPRPHMSGKPVIVGHSQQKDGEVLDLGYVVCIDTYCCGGQWLTALDVESGLLYQTNEKGQRRAGGPHPLRREAS